MTDPRALDALVAEKVMGWKRWDGEGWCPDPQNMFWVPKAHQFSVEKVVRNEVDTVKTRPFTPTTDIAHAWEVVAKVCADEDADEQPFNLTCRYSVSPDHSGHKNPNLWRAAFLGEGSYAPERCGVASAPTAPLAICRAALAACGVDIPQEVDSPA